MNNLTDTQDPAIDTTRGSTFPYQFGVDFLRKNVVVFNSISKKSKSYAPSELQRLAADETLDPHRHALYQAGWDYWLSQQAQKSTRAL